MTLPLTHSFSSIGLSLFSQTIAHPLHQHTSVILTALMFWGYSVLHFPHPFPILNSVIVLSKAVWRDERERVLPLCSDWRWISEGSLSRATGEGEKSDWST